MNPEVFNYLHDDADHMMWENQPLEDLAGDGELIAYKHTGFWKCMDTLRDKNDLENMWNTDPERKQW